MENSRHRRPRGSALSAIFAVTTALAASAALASCGNAPIIQGTPSPSSEASPSSSPSPSPSASATPTSSASPSPSASASPAALAAPLPIAVAGSGSATISWPEVPDATSYNVYWRTSSYVTKANGTRIAGVTRPFIHSALTNGYAYYYVVTALNGGVESADSATVSARPIAAPALPSLVPSFAKVSLSWAYTSGADSYNVYWSTSPGVTPATGTKASVTSRSFDHVGLAGGTRYYYVVSGSNPTGESSASPEASAVAYFDPYRSAGKAVIPGGSASGDFRGVAIDGAGNRIAVGRQYGNSAFSYGSGASATGGYASGNNAVVVKYDASGNAVWARSVAGGDLAESGFHAVAVDASGNIYAAGYVCGTKTYDFGGKSVTGKNAGSSFALVKYDPAGNALWAATVYSSNASSTNFYGVAVDGSGNAYGVGDAGGPYMSGFQLSPTVSLAAIGGTAPASNAFIAKYDADGAAQWCETLATAPANSRFNGAAADASGNVYAVGYIGGNSTFDFGSGATVSGANSNYSGTSCVIVKYGPGGAAQWARSATSSSSSSGGSFYNAVALDASANAVYAAGYLKGNFSYGFGPSASASGPSAGYDSVALVKYDSSGNAQWARTTFSSNTASAWFHGVAVDGSGDCYAAGYIYGDSLYDFGESRAAAGPLSGRNGLVLAKYDSTGKVRWAQSASAASAENKYNAVAVDSAGNACAVGYSTGTSTVGLGNAASAAGSSSGTNALAGFYAP